MTIVPATPELIREYYGDVKLPTMRAWVVLEDGKPIGVGGFLRVNRNIRAIFSDTSHEQLARHKLSAMKFAKMLLKIADENGWTLVADPDCNLETAKGFLSHLGFQPNERGEYVR